METLTRASDELFRRGPDERFDSLQSLYDHCYATRTNSIDRWHPPQSIQPAPHGGRFRVTVGNDGEFSLNDWSFGQLCRLAGVSKETVNRVSAGTAAQIFRETMPSGDKPLQLLTQDDAIRSIHGTAYTNGMKLTPFVIVGGFLSGVPGVYQVGEAFSTAFDCSWFVAIGA